MGRSAPVPPPPPPFNPLEPLKDAFLYSGDFKWMFYVSLAGFCAANGAAVLTATPKINYFHGCALMVLMCFGGSTMAAIMCGKPVAFVCNEALVPVCLSVWTVMYLLPDVTINFFKKNKVGILFTSAMYEMMRCHVLMNCTAMAAGTLGNVLAVPSADRVPIIGPLIAGTLGGCGGGFMPLNKGLDPLEKGTNWRIGSGLVNSLWLHLSMQNPATTDMIGLGPTWCRFIAASFFVFIPLIEILAGVASPFGANPLVPPAVAGDKKKK